MLCLVFVVLEVKWNVQNFVFHEMFEITNLRLNKVWNIMHAKEKTNFLTFKLLFLVFLCFSYLEKFKFETLVIYGKEKMLLKK